MSKKLKRTSMSIKRRRRTPQPVQYVRDNLVVVLTSLGLSLLLGGLLGRLLTPERWWAGLIIAFAALLACEFCHYKSRYTR